jgi:hypothetical protein
MRLFIMPDGKGEGVDAVVCERCIENDYDINENNGMSDLEQQRYLNGLDVAPAASYCWLCGVDSA